MTDAPALALAFKADWEIWSIPMPSVGLQAFKAEVCEILRPWTLCPATRKPMSASSVKIAMAI